MRSDIEVRLGPACGKPVPAEHNHNVVNAGRMPVPGKLSWRYKYADQQAARDGDCKYLKVPDNTLLFDVVEDPMERANLKERHRDVYDRLVAQWTEWNATMLPLDPQSFTLGFTGAELADHYGVKAGA
jgi:hypothetical protein